MPTIDLDKVNALADLLIEARTAHRALEPLSEELAPSSADEAAAVDDRVAEVSGWTLRGWKIGCTSEHAQQMLGASGPFAGRVYSLFEGDSTVGAEHLLTEPNVEGEFAFIVGETPKAGPDGHDPETVTAAIAELRPAIELVGGRYARFVGTPLWDLVADGGANSHLIIGPPADSWDPASLAATGARMEVDGSITGSGVGADVLGGPLTALAWLANHLTERGIQLEPGQVVTTGTATQVSALPVGSTATVTLDGLGSVSLTRR